MLRYFLFLTVGVCVLRGATSKLTVQQNCGASDAVSRSVNLSIRCKRNETGKWVTTFAARGGADELPDGLTLDLTQTVIECDGKEMVQVQGVLGGDNPHIDSPAKEKKVSLAFYGKTGPNIDISNNGRTAVRRNVDSAIGGGSVITSRALKDNELFEVRLDRAVTKWGRSICVGVTTHTPTDIKFLDHMNSFKSGVWIYYLHNIFNNGDDIRPGYGVDLEKLEIGDRVGVTRKRDGALHFFVNGVDQGAAPANVTGTVYGVMDLYGNPIQATIVNPP